VKKDSKLQTYGIDPQWGLAQAIYQMIYQQNGTIFSADLATADFTTSSAINALQWYVNYAQAHIGPSPFDPDPNGWDGPTYLAKRLGVSQFGYWFGGEIATGSTDVQSVSRMIPAPQMGTNRISASYAGVGLWIAANSKHPDAAWRFMEYYLMGTPAHERAKSGWGVPSFKALLPEMPQTLPYQKESYQTLQEELKYFQTLPVSPYTTSTAVGTLLDKYLQQAVRKQLTVNQAAQELTADVNKLLQQGKQAIS
jgi:multiple sugar transport system substrate-binding protein